MARYAVALVLVVASMIGCDNSEELRDLERGRDNPPAIDATPPDEAN